MTVYADVLVSINVLIDYFLLLLTEALLSRKCRVFRRILSAVLCGLGSLYLFLPSLPMVVDLLTRLFFCSLVCLLCFGFHGVWPFLKCTAAYIGINCLFGGVMTLLFTVFKPHGMVFHNGVVYFDISAIEMLAVAAVAYVLLCVGQWLVRRHSPAAKRCLLHLSEDGRSLETRAMVDTGLALIDVYAGRPVVVTDAQTASCVLGDLDKRNPLLLPCRTVTGQELIPAYPVKEAHIGPSGRHPILLAVGKTTLDGDYRAIISPGTWEELQ